MPKDNETAMKGAGVTHQFDGFRAHAASLPQTRLRSVSTVRAFKGMGGSANTP